MTKVNLRNPLKNCGLLIPFPLKISFLYQAIAGETFFFFSFSPTEQYWSILITVFFPQSAMEACKKENSEILCLTPKIMMGDLTVTARRLNFQVTNFYHCDEKTVFSSFLSFCVLILVRIDL